MQFGQNLLPDSALVPDFSCLSDPDSEPDWEGIYWSGDRWRNTWVDDISPSNLEQRSAAFKRELCRAKEMCDCRARELLVNWLEQESQELFHDTELD